MNNFGPRTEFGQLIHSTKYRAPEESFDDYCVRWSRATTNCERDFRRALRYTRDQLLLPAGRQQFSMGRPYLTTAYNCFVGGVIPDSYEGIMEALKEGGMTLRTGGGVGWNFDTLRPKGDPIRGLGFGSFASGPISFMRIWDTNCETILTAGHRRGAMMGVMRVDHPDILEFISAKRATGQLKNFNISVGITDGFLEALESDGLYPLKFGGSTYSTVRAVDVWARIMESNWDWAEPGVLFIDRINERNPLRYCETIFATNPCAEQPLPPYGACLLGSINLVKTLIPSWSPDTPHSVDNELLDDAVDTAVRCFDNVPEHTIFPLPQQKEEALSKRRMGLGVTAMANTLEILGFRYGSPEYLAEQSRILERIARRAYLTSIELGKEKGPFPLFDSEEYGKGWFLNEVMDEEIRNKVKKEGIRNGLLLSIAPTGTISMAADNVSSGIEPPYSLHGKVMIYLPEGQKELETTDYAKEFFGVDSQTAEETSAEQHVDVLCAAQKWVDSSISKTCNVNGQVAGEGPGVTFRDFKELYLRAYHGGAKGCTTFNKNGQLEGVRKSLDDEGGACTVDPTTGVRSCDF